MTNAMWSWLDEFPHQFQQAFDLAGHWELEALPSADQIIFLGMGGSAIGADLICSLFRDRLSRPAIVVRGEDAPAFLGSNSLVVAISYSGETRETLTALQQALDRGARAVCLGSGGTLLKVAVEKRLPYLRLPGGLAPRAAIGYLSIPLIAVLQRAGALPPGLPGEEEKREALQLLQSLRVEWGESAGPGSGVARRLLRRLPIITAGKTMIIAARRFQAQLAENAKALSVPLEMPEALHNLIETLDVSYIESFRPMAVYLEDPEADAHSKRQMTKAREAFQAAGLEGIPIMAQGEKPLARLFSLVHKCDWISYHLATLKGVDPVAIPIITNIKQSLSKA
jgi:glucose/mannose-6-phosphate isomerase